jgi:transcriptional regulator with XRE-family HTH domain
VDAGRSLREARRRAGLTQRALALRAGIPQPTIARIESHAVVPRVDTLDRLLSACGFALDTLRRPGLGVDRTGIRELRRLRPVERLRLAAEDARNLDRLVAQARRR